MPLTNELIDATVANITGYIIANVAKETGRDVREVLIDFFHSETYSLLTDKSTGLYWDSIAQTQDRFTSELGYHAH